MARKESTQSHRMREFRSTGNGIATWKLLVVVLFMVVLGALGAYSLQVHRSSSSPLIDFGFSSASTQEASAASSAS